MLADILILSIAFLAVWITLFVAFPWMARRVAVYGLHGLRDRLFRLAVDEPWLRGSILYRDADFILAYSIRTARELPYEEFVQTALSIETGRLKGASDGMLRAYAADLDSNFTTPYRRDVLSQVSRILEQQRGWYTIRVVFGHGGVIPVSALVLTVAFIWSLVRDLGDSNSDNPTEQTLRVWRLPPLAA